MSEELSKLLNSEQYKAVTHLNGPLLIFAGAGSGKTRVIAYRIYNLIANNAIHPRNILALTFTNKAANEMKGRIKTLTDFSYTPLVTTFHSFGLKMLRIYSEEAGVKNNFVVYDDTDQEQLIKKILKKFNLDVKDFKPSSYQERINLHKDNLLMPSDLIKDYRMLPDEIEVYEEYEKAKEANNALDFSDLIMKCWELLKKPVSKEIINQFNYILVDEFQDTNFAQYKILKLLTEKHNNICVVGDDDQSIYSWRGAIMMNILNFEKDFRNTTVIKLEQNYRSTQQILDFSNSIIKNNMTREKKKLITNRKNGEQPIIRMLNDEYHEAKYVLSKIKELKESGKYRYKDIAIFFRTNLQSRIFEEKFREYNMPYIIVGATSFYCRKEIKDIIAYLKLIVNPDDSISLLRIINMPKRNIGSATINKLIEFADANNMSLFSMISQPDKLTFLKAGIIAKLNEFSRLIERYIERAKKETVDIIILNLVDDLKYREIMETSKDIRDNSRVGNVDEFINSACEFVKTYRVNENIESDLNENVEDVFSLYDSNEKPTTSKFLEKISMFSETDKLDENSDCINMMTYHCAKGLEFPVVFMVGMEEGFLPHCSSMQNSDELEEERRLCYVGITRAKDLIIFTHAFQRYNFGKLINPDVSRFILEARPDYEPTIRILNKHNFYNRTKDLLLTNADNVNFKKNEKEPENKKVKHGDKVLHSKFGPGKVLMIDEVSDKIKISFAKHGLKLFSLKIVKLNKM